MLLHIKKLKIVVLEYPYFSWDNPMLADFMHKTISLKLRGYRHEYQSTVMPIDTTDFICIHLLVCLEKGDELIPIMASKTTTLSRSKNHRLMFPGLALVTQAKAQEHINVVQQIITAAEMNNKELGYFASWTIDPEVRKDRILTAHLREIFKGLYVNFHNFYKIDELLIGGTIRFQTEKIFSEIGHEALSKEGKPLPTINVHHLYDEEVLLMYLKKYSDKAKQDAIRWKSLWEDRQVISVDKIGSGKKLKVS